MSGSRFHSDQSGLFGFIFGMVGLVLFGVMVSLLYDARLGSGGAGGSAAAHAEHQEAMVRALEQEFVRLEAAGRKQSEWALAESRLEGVIHAMAAPTVEAEELEAAIETQREWLEKTAAQFETYQVGYRDRLWQQAVGRSMSRLVCKDGKDYDEVVIAQVSATGLRIRHRSGTAQIETKRLPKELRDELLLDLVESQRVLRERRKAELEAHEEQRQARIAAVAVKPRPKAKPKKARAPAVKDDEEEEDEPDPADRLEILTLHEQIAGLQTRLARLQSELFEAQARAAGAGRSRSPAGSLETWEERADRLSRVSIRADAQLRLLEARLEALDPRRENRRR